MGRREKWRLREHFEFSGHTRGKRLLKKKKKGVLNQTGVANFLRLLMFKKKKKKKESLIKRNVKITVLA